MSIKTNSLAYKEKKSKKLLKDHLHIVLQQEFQTSRFTYFYILSVTAVYIYDTTFPIFIYENMKNIFGEQN